MAEGKSEKVQHKEMESLGGEKVDDEGGREVRDRRGGRMKAERFLKTHVRTGIPPSLSPSSQKSSTTTASKIT